jgi:hypothetical protein
MMAYTGMEVKKERHGVLAIVGRAICADCPKDCSMYMSSLALIVGCFDGFSKDNHNQIMYQMMPAIPGITKHISYWGVLASKLLSSYVGFSVLTAVVMRISIFWDI